ncbi:MAG: DNA-deoxyinosine glycosylase [Lachnospiraceae bacterium]|nr:DNA-deoxyinosine glycosylase [Lachnospiraceae bacterium]
MKEYFNLKHTFEPVWNKNSKVLVLGTFPSVKSREYGFYYGHPQNRFWKVAASITGQDVPVTTEEKKKLLLANNIALWDVISSCSIKGSSDSSIKDVVANNLIPLLDGSSITKIYANGTKAYELYMKYSYTETGIKIVKLPSTSPANAVYTLEKLVAAWSVLIDK